MTRFCADHILLTMVLSVTFYDNKGVEKNTFETDYSLDLLYKLRVGDQVKTYRIEKIQYNIPDQRKLVFKGRHNENLVPGNTLLAKKNRPKKYF